MENGPKRDKEQRNMAKNNPKIVKSLILGEKRDFACIFLIV
jgi:hypothetical protein